MIYNKNISILKLTRSFLSSGYVLVLLAVLIGFYGLYFAQHLKSYGTLGDETIYGKITQGFPSAVFGRKLDDYRIKRILPLGLVHYSLRLFRQPLTLENIARCFSVWHILLLGLIAHLWNLIAKEMQVTNKGRLLGFIAMFCNYHFLKHIPFVQITTDVFAYTAMFALVYFYLKDNLPGMFLLSLLGAFSWPTVFHMGICLMLFRKDKPQVFETSGAPFKFNYILPAGLLIFILFNINWILKVIYSGKIFSYGIFSMGSNRPIMSIIYLSIAVVMTYLFTALSVLLNGRKIFDFRYWLSKFDLVRVIVVALMIIGVKLIIHFGAASHNARPLDYLIKNLLIVSIMQPGTFFICHVLFFGPLLVFSLFLWKPLCTLVRSYGPGLILCFIIVILFSLDSESRKQMNTYSLFVPFLIKTIDSLEWKRAQVWFIWGVSLLFSKMWLMFPEGWDTGSMLDFPKQYYAMSMGPWMSHSMYAVQGSIVIFLIFVVYVLVIQKRKLRP